MALAPTAAARRRGIKQLRDQDDPLATEFDAAKLRADRLGQLVRSSGHYPLLGGGDINLYSLFVERAMRLVKPDGIVGLLTPSGIYADKTAARFFKSVSTGGRIGGLFDFENRRLGTELPPYFPDVDSRFKFCALIFRRRRAPLRRNRVRLLPPRHRRRPRPGSLLPPRSRRLRSRQPQHRHRPIFRTRRDADITRRIYERHPILVDRSDDEEVRAWPVRYVRMLDMANDSHHFRTAAQLDADGFYPVEVSRWKKGDILYLPMYQGRMIHQFDHRANSVRVNSESTHNPYLSEEVSEAQHADPRFLPHTQYWVPAERVDLALPNPSAGPWASRYCQTNRHAHDDRLCTSLGRMWSHVADSISRPRRVIWRKRDSTFGRPKQLRL